MNLYHVIAVSVVALFAGCSSTPRPGNYECELHDDPAAKCASMHRAYGTSQGLTSAEAGAVQSVFEGKGAKGAPPANARSGPVVGAQPSGYPDVGEAGMPVFSQPKVMRVWVAPYVDAEGNLRSGEYTYFSTPGQWNYGELKKPGAASGMFAPARADNLGFTPSTSTKAAPPKPAETVRPDTTGMGGTPQPLQVTPAPVAQGSAVAPAQSPTQITQPYQRLTGN